VTEWAKYSTDYLEYVLESEPDLPFEDHWAIGDILADRPDEVKYFG